MKFLFLKKCNRDFDVNLKCDFNRNHQIRSAWRFRKV